MDSPIFNRTHRMKSKRQHVREIFQGFPVESLEEVAGQPDSATFVVVRADMTEICEKVSTYTAHIKITILQSSDKYLNTCMSMVERGSDRNVVVSTTIGFRPQVQIWRTLCRINLIIEPFCLHLFTPTRPSRQRTNFCSERGKFRPIVSFLTFRPTLVGGILRTRYKDRGQMTRPFF